MQLRIKAALFSVSDRTGVEDFARFLAQNGVKLLATGGTCKALRDAGLTVMEVGEYTGQPEIMDGRVKTLHPKVHAGILADRSNPAHMQALAEVGADSIDLVCVNLYPFEQQIVGNWHPDDAGYASVIEKIDIGGPTMIRAAAKNHAHVTVVTSPEQFAAVRADLAASEGVSVELRRRLAFEAFRRTAAYDAAISTWLDHQVAHYDDLTPEQHAPEVFVRRYDRRFDLRYGENPHQKAAFYAECGPPTASIASARLVRGDTISYNNILDCDSALQLAGEFDHPSCAVIKHTNPCGAAVADDIVTAFRNARDADPVSAYGGILGFNRAVTEELAEAIAEKGQFFECIVAPAFTHEALAVFDDTRKSWLTRLRLLAVGDDGNGKLSPERPRPEWVVRGVEGGLLVQGTNVPVFDVSTDGGMPWRVATTEAPADAQIRDLNVAWTVCKHVKSNAIVIARNGVAIGVGAGQMSRIESVQLAIGRIKDPAGAAGAVLASDAFFPFADGVQAALKAGVKAIIQPGGSKRDDESIRVCNDANVPMLFTGMRHFRH